MAINERFLIKIFFWQCCNIHTCTFILKWGVDGEMLTCNRSSHHLQPEDEISTNSFFHLLFVSLCFHVMSTKRGHHFTISPVYHVHYHMIDHVTKLWKITLTCYLGRRRPKQIERGGAILITSEILTSQNNDNNNNNNGLWLCLTLKKSGVINPPAPVPTPMYMYMSYEYCCFILILNQV